MAEKFTGKLKLGGPESERQSVDNIYSFELIPLNKISSLRVYPGGLKKRILKRFLG
ncbi:MAG: hypothetical protein ACP5NV_01535 [Candidatus Woesearchaeota archaeon]